MSLILDNYLEKGDSDEYKKEKIKLVANSRIKHIVVLIYYIL